MAIRHVLSILSASLLTCALATGAVAATNNETKKAQSTQAPKQKTTEKKKQQKSWEPICPPDCGSAKR